jgi:hypothetical protein
LIFASLCLVGLLPIVRRKASPPDNRTLAELLPHAIDRRPIRNIAAAIAAKARHVSRLS